MCSGGRGGGAGRPGGRPQRTRRSRAPSRTHRHTAGPAHHPSPPAPTVSRHPPPVPPGMGPPFTVRSETIMLFDPSRSTPARGKVPASPGRRLVTDLLVPSGVLAPMPLVVFAHGWNSNPTVYQPLLEQWAQAGFLVAAPVFPDSTDLYPGSPVSDYADQAEDMSFVITSLLHSHVVSVDPTRIAVAGHSDGGTDVALLALDPAYADPRVRAVVCLSGELPSGVAPYTVRATPGRAPRRSRVGRRIRPRTVDAPRVPGRAGVVEGDDRGAGWRPPRLLRGRDAGRGGHARGDDALLGAGARATVTEHG